MIHKVTEAMVSIEGENMRGVTWVVVEEVKSGSWAIGGKALTTEDVKALQRPVTSDRRVVRGRVSPARSGIPADPGRFTPCRS